ncbi:hypothetical protein [Corynebacterium glyciniphilum]|uniref:hypothetical protein n=1 Tax=Corynebacterium glyciniphilum TaxID=1404244 RepID=UPI003FD19510
MPKTYTDQSDDTGCVIPCTLCDYRAATDTPADAWHAMYRHLRDHHRSEHAAKLTEQAKRNAYRQQAKRSRTR